MRKILIPFILIGLWLTSCDLDRVELGSGNATKFETAVGGSANEFPRDMLINSDGSIVIAGYSQSFTTDNNNQAYIIKLDKNGGTVWEHDFGGTADDYANAIIATTDGGYVFCGTTSSFNPNLSDDLYIVKINSQGGVVWSKSYGVIDSTEIGFGLCPVGTSDFLVGYTSWSNGSDVQVRFMRINGNGSKLSDKLGLNGPYYISQMIKTADNMIVLTGSEYTTSTSAYIAKFMEDGNLIWDQSFSGQIQNYTPAYGVVELSDNSLFVSGSYLGNSDHDFLALSYTSIGMMLIDTAWGGANADELMSITKTPDGNVVVTGYTNSFSTMSEIYLSKRNKSNGKEIWTKHFGDIPGGGDIVRVCPDGGFAVCAYQNVANADIGVFKTDANGEYQ